jgi:uncharacterized protein (TIGR02001 family)
MKTMSTLAVAIGAALGATAFPALAADKAPVTVINVYEEGAPAAAPAAAPTAEAESPHSLSANVAMTTNYMFRGVSQTDNGPAVQGGFDYEYTPYGLYAGVWGSNVSSEGFAGASMELDLYVGWRPSWEGLSFDIGYLRYQYPTTDFDDNNTDEFKIGVSYETAYFTPSYTAYYSPDFFGDGDSWYHDVSVDVPLPYEITLSAHYGWNRFEGDLGFVNYEDWKVALSREFFGIGTEIAYVDRSDDDLCGPPFQCGSTAVFTVSKSF